MCMRTIQCSKDPDGIKTEREHELVVFCSTKAFILFLIPQDSSICCSFQIMGFSLGLIHHELTCFPRLQDLGLITPQAFLVLYFADWQKSMWLIYLHSL